MAENTEKPKREFSEEELLILQEDDRFIMRVVKWGRMPVLAKQEKFEDKETGEMRKGKVKGLSLADIELIEQKLDVIKKAMTAAGGIAGNKGAKK